MAGATHATVRQPARGQAASELVATRRATVPTTAGQSAALSAWQHVLGNQTLQQRAAGCPAFSACPTGGTCHPCPFRVQTKLAVSRPGDPYEREADRVADAVMRMPGPDAGRLRLSGPAGSVPRVGHAAGADRSAPAATPRLTAGAMIQRDDLSDVEIESERMGREFREERRRQLREITRRLRAPSATGATRGFRLEHLQQVQSLRFAGNLGQIPEAAQKVLLPNIEATVRFVLDPKNPQRVAEIARLRKIWSRQFAKLPRFETPAERVDVTDLYHGHICVPRPVLERLSGQLAADLNRLAVEAGPYASRAGSRTIGEDIQQAIGMGMPASLADACRVIGVVTRHQSKFMRLLGQMVKALSGVSEAAVVYHTWESARPMVEGRRLPSEHPIREIVTPLSSSQPRFGGVPGAPHCQPLLNFSFYIGPQGDVTLLPGAVGEAVRAIEWLFRWERTPGERPADLCARMGFAQRQAEPGAAAQSPPQIQRACADCDDEAQREVAGAGDDEDRVQAKEAPDRAPMVTPPVQARIAGLRGEGRPLDPATRAFFEPRLGRDLGGVRVHIDAASTRTLRARAYTLGRDIVFAPGRYTPAAPEGRRLLAHELTHVVQQSDGAPTVQRQMEPGFERDPIHGPLIEAWRREHGLPPGGVDPVTGAQVGPTDAELRFGGELDRWLRRGAVPRPTTTPRLVPAAPVFNPTACGTVSPGMPAADAERIRGCIHHARFVNLMNQSIIFMGQVGSPYAPGLAAFYRTVFQQVVRAGQSSHPTSTSTKSFTVTNAPVAVSSSTSLTVPTFTLQLEQVLGGNNGSFLGNTLTLNEASGSAITNDQADVERTMYHEGIHFLSAEVAAANRAVRAGGPGVVVRHELDPALVNLFRSRFEAATTPLWTEALRTLGGVPAANLGRQAGAHAALHWFKVSDEIVSRVEEAVYLALRQGRGFSLTDLAALPQPWLFEAAYWPSPHISRSAMQGFLTSHKADIETQVLPVVRAVQERFLQERPVR